MITEVFTDDLVDAVAVAAKASSTRSTLEVLQCVLLRVDGDRLIVTGYDLETGIRVEIPATGYAGWAIAVNARRFNDTMTKLDGEAAKTTLELNERTQTLTVRVGNQEVRIKGFDAAEYPIVPTIAGTEGREDCTRFTVPIEQLLGMMDSVAFAASTDESRPTLTGIETQLEAGVLQLVGTDGYRLAVQKATLAGVNGEMVKTIIPRKIVNGLRYVKVKHKAHDDAKGLATIVVTDRAVIVGIASDGALRYAEVCSALIDARYPDWRAIVPKAWTTRAHFDVAAFKRKVALANLYAKENANIVRMKIVPPSEANPEGMIIFRASSSEYGDTEGTIRAEVEGMELEIAMNGKYLLEYLNSADAGTLTMEGQQPTRPLVFKGLDDENFHVIMPMHPPR